MRKRRTRWWNLAFVSVVTVLVVAIASGLVYMVRAAGGTLPIEGQASDFTATNVDGRNVRFSSLDGKIRLVTWFYTHCPDVCPLTAHRMQQIQTKLEAEGVFASKVDIVAIDLDPESDSLHDIRIWSSHFDPDYHGWYFVRTDPEHTKRILKAWGVERKLIPGSVYVSHTIKTVLVDEDGNIRKTYNTANLNVDEVASDVNGLIRREKWGV
ncbi:SCO family protein [Alicyclobacillus shizuokensis]|uniref:SCO family protein n=1 Tax=Alicyclobacillus shizuokensis TaxID=392014 RepID=UPI000834F939|nr:SCO family protein [Alicyclobacillus shizuokensis]MCL6625594.1 SCO family protein [Alicyclobacillus shizuokensis]